MSITTPKTKQLIARTCRWLVCLLITGLALLPASALAASKNYAITCVGSNVKITNGRLACTASPAVAKIEGIGGARQPLPAGSGVSTVTVNCGSSRPVDPPVGSNAAFRCRNGSAPRINNLSQVQSYNGGPVTPGPHGPTTACNATSCDLVDQYVNPAINLLSAVFGLVAVISLILGGIQYSTSEGDPQKSSNAKNRITSTVVAIFAYALLYGFLQFLVPGGLFH